MILRVGQIVPAMLIATLPLMAQAQPMQHGEGGMTRDYRHAMMAQHAPRLTVLGEGQAAVQPDLAVVSLGVTSQADTAAAAMADNSTQQAAVIEALQGQGIEARDIQTSGLSLSAMMDYSEGRAPAITGYQAQNMVTVRVREVARLGEMLDALVQAGANEVQGISFQREDAQDAADDARASAVTEARRRAEVLAQAAGMRLGPVVSLRDVAAATGPQPMMMARAESAGSVPVQAGELTITAQVEMVFSMIGPDQGTDQENGEEAGGETGENTGN
ncbi:MAG: SIMPL domain-containing protein [Paracoccus sp. (in: a-proteobacteria)]|uniref:SIMPL domain-containing protein n=1 Tax=Paracoccus sp. TaxID=267 RepID=UPI0026DFD9C7|nr:SIMPL domain-containing protein [Paracoccus sp. (in: a-proteobacteria)]MDO5614491.1 SIMPL domain-containing protein [Paracoccus sp. (in: a-proteobacteria)]